MIQTATLDTAKSGAISVQNRIERLEREKATLIAALESAADGFRVIADKAAPTVAKYAAEKRDAASAVLAQVQP